MLGKMMLSIVSNNVSIEVCCFGHSWWEIFARRLHFLAGINPSINDEVHVSFNVFQCHPVALNANNATGRYTKIAKKTHEAASSWSDLSAGVAKPGVCV